MNHSSPKSPRPLGWVALLAGLVIVCVAVSFLTAHLMVQPEQWARHDQPHGHHWLHQELDLTDSEAAAIDALEDGYRESREQLRTEFETDIEELRKLLTGNDEFTPEVEHAIHQLHEIHGQLQELSIRHYFQMLDVLPPEKRTKLRQIASEALSVPE